MLFIRAVPFIVQSVRRTRITAKGPPGLARTRSGQIEDRDAGAPGVFAVSNHRFDRSMLRSFAAKVACVGLSVRSVCSGLAGNGMNLAQIGSCLMFALASAELVS
jgi:hypothetical protein